MSSFEGYPFGEGVGEFARIEIDALDFEKAAVSLNELALYLENVQLPLRGAQKIAQDDMKERFDSEVAPDGTRWAALDPDYEKRKEHDRGFIHPILTRDRALRDAATSNEAWNIGPESIWFNTSNLPEYWRIHQEGSEDFGSVFHSSFTEETGHQESSAGSGAQNIPPRPFIGLSDKAEAEILDLFDVWFGKGVENAAKSFFISSAGVVHERVGGRIGPVLFG